MNLQGVGEAEEEKSFKFQGGGESTVNFPGTENSGGWGVKLKKTLRGGYGYFLEPHTVSCHVEILLSYLEHNFS